MRIVQDIRKSGENHAEVKVDGHYYIININGISTRNEFISRVLEAIALEGAQRAESTKFNNIKQQFEGADLDG